MPLTHTQKESVTRMYTELAQARGIVAGMRSSVFFRSGDVDPVSVAIAGLQNKLEEVLRTGEVPEIPPLFGVYS